ncbi:unnamed protein product, partial [Amoebophrya sp. A25]|eukprot:GSA25T00010254001.1
MRTLTLTSSCADYNGRLRHSHSMLACIVLLVSFLLSSSFSNSVVSGLQLRAAGAGDGTSKDEEVTRRRRLEMIDSVSDVEYVVDVVIPEKTGITVAQLLAEFRYYGRTKKEVEEEEEMAKMKNDIEVEVKRRPAYGFSPVDKILNEEERIQLTLLEHEGHPEQVLKSDSEEDIGRFLRPENLFDSGTDKQKMVLKVVFVDGRRTGSLTLRVRNEEQFWLESYKRGGSKFDEENPYRGESISVHPFYDVEWWKGMTFDDLEQELRRKDAEARRANPDREFGVLDHSDSVAPRIWSQVWKFFSTFFSRAGRSSSTTSTST